MFVNKNETDADKSDAAARPVVMIVEDSAIMRRLIIRTLALEGDYTYVEAENASDAVRKISNGLPDLIILDIALGVESGFNLLASLKQNPSTETIPVIVCSANSEQPAIDKSEQLGAAGFIPKPISSQVLREKVRKILDPHYEEEQAE